jgi:hypothetical protein
MVMSVMLVLQVMLVIPVVEVIPVVLAKQGQGVLQAGLLAYQQSG